MCKRIMDCTGEGICELCEVIVENEKQREVQEMKRMQAYDVVKLGHEYEEWDAQP